ncbi:4'-phosphopantetheinyl transferase superfamily protein [Mucilaginibacter sp.]|uniref:holo-ACP synthase n=1 Tax=Mucilaginibacter sp. TaxID=1882438 RepID=UPI00283BBE15|nr:4'-phosphopantetheinyl transferase superfamily protein [Mucilaginibacter sp.]MDR3696114.1 4'-phosphopantetheinyl transferase superfamily protein [Mucilaginibacter sp.]
MENEILKTLEIINAAGRFTIGNDLVYLPDFSASFNALFKKKVYTAAEITYCDAFENSALRYASTWAAKEAVYKAIKQISPSTLGWKKIEIIRKKNAGQPQVIIHNPEANYKISLTISHDGDYVWAIALIDTDL